MNIWLVTTEYPPEGGGIGTYVGNAARMFAAAGHHITVFKAGRQSREWFRDGIQLVEFVTRDQFLEESPDPSLEPDEHPAFPYNSMSYWPALSYQFAAELKQWIAKTHLPDIIEVQDYGAIGYYLIIRRLLQEEPFCRIPVVVHLHGPHFEMARINQAPRYKLPDYWIGQMEKFCIRAADGLSAPSLFLAKQIKAAVADDLPISIIPYPYQSLPEPALPPTPGDVLYFGRVDYLKGSLQLVESCARLWQTGQNFTLTLIGGDNVVKSLNQSAKQYLRHKYREDIDAGRLIICDPLPPAELYPRVAQAWCVIIPSLYENFPNACIEAMLLNKVVVASTSGGQAEMIGSDGQAGLLFDWNNSGDFETKLRCVLSMSPEENRKMGQQARQRISKLTAVEQVSARKLDLYRQIISQSQGPRSLYPATQPGILAQNEDLSRPRLLSVIIPYYNLGQYLPETLDSVLASTYTPLEVIIVNDGSTDQASLQVLDNIEARRDERIRLISIENSGVSHARNMGAKNARGEYLALIDADDKVEPEFFSKAVQILQRYPNVSFVYSWVRFFGAQTGCWITFNAEFPYLLGQNMVTIMSVVRRDHFLRYGQHRPKIKYPIEDYDGWLRMMAAGCIGVSIPELLVKYRVRSDSRYQSINYDQLLYIYDLITHDYAQNYQEHAVDLINLLLANGPSFVWNHPGARWQSPLEQLEDLNHRYQVELDSQDFVTRHFVRLSVANLLKTFKNPGRAWQKFLKWYYHYFGKDEIS